MATPKNFNPLQGIKGMNLKGNIPYPGPKKGMKSVTKQVLPKKKKNSSVKKFNATKYENARKSVFGMNKFA